MPIFVNMQLVNNIEVIWQEVSILLDATLNICYQLHYKIEFRSLLLCIFINNIIDKVEDMRYSVVIHSLGLYSITNLLVLFYSYKLIQLTRGYCLFSIPTL